MSESEPAIVLGIPGCWEDRSALITGIMMANPDVGNPEFMAAGAIIMNPREKYHFGFEIYDRQPELREAFGYEEGWGRPSEADLERIIEVMYGLPNSLPT